MLKKTLPLLVISGIILVGCTNNEAIPENNDTPVENIHEDAREIKEDVEQDVEQDTEGRDIYDGTNDGTMNEDKDNNDEIRKGDTNYDPEIDEEGNVD